LYRRLGGPQSQSGHIGYREKKNYLEEKINGLLAVSYRILNV
jgi:hypothetical protein